MKTKPLEGHAKNGWALTQILTVSIALWGYWSEYVPLLFLLMFISIMRPPLEPEQIRPWSRIDTVGYYIFSAVLGVIGGILLHLMVSAIYRRR